MYHRLDCVIVEKVTEVLDDFTFFLNQNVLRVYPTYNFSFLELS